MSASNESSPWPWRTLLGLLAVAFLHGAVYLVMLPHWMGEDEPWHLQNVVMIHEGFDGEKSEFHHEEQREQPLSHLHVRRRFGKASFEEVKAIEDGLLASMESKGYWRRVDWVSRNTHMESFDEILIGITASNNPLLYYYAAAPLLAMFPEAEPRFQLLLVRLLSLFLFVGTVGLTFLAARRVFPSGPGAVLAALWIAFWPMSARGAAVVNNDVMTRFWVALALFLAAYWITRPDRDGLTGRRAIWFHAWPLLAMLAVSGLALLTKTSGASSVAIVGLAVLLHPASLARLKGTLLALLGLGAVIAGGAAYWLSTHNAGVTLSLEENLGRLKEGLSLTKLANLRDTLVGKLNWESRTITPDFSQAWGWFFAAVLGLSLIGLFARRDWLRSRLLWLAWGASSVQLLLMAMRGVSKGRYLMPMAPALAILLVAGLFVLVPKRLQPMVAVSATGLLLVFDAFFVWHGLGREAWLVWGW